MGRRALIACVAAASLAAAVAAAWPVASYRAQTLLAALGVALALHGLGRALTWRDRTATTAQVVSLGLAGYLVLGGWLAAAGLLTRPVALAIGAAGLSTGVAWLAVTRPRWSPSRDPIALAIAGLAAVTTAVAILAGAGAHGAEFSDGDGLLRGAVARLGQVGALDDGVGLPRQLGLGGSTVVLSLGAALPDLAALHAIDAGLGLGLVLALLVPRTLASPARGYGSLAILALVVGVPLFPPDLAPRWTAVALVIALHDALDDARRDHRSALYAIALASLGHAGLAALVAVALTDRRRATATAIALLGLGGYLVAAATASGLDLAAPSPSRLGFGAAVTVVLWALAGLATRAWRDPGLGRWQTAIAAAIGGGVAAAPSTGLAGAMIAPYVIALVLIWTARACAASDGRRPLVVVIAFLVVLVPAGLRFRVGIPPRTWGDRWADQLDDLRATAAPAAPLAAAADYRAAQAAIPAGARVAVWVEAAELLDYRRHRIVDLRSAAAAACVGRRQRLDRPSPQQCRRLARSRATIAADFLIVSPSAWLPADDPLALHLARGQRPRTTSELTVVELARASP